MYIGPCAITNLMSLALLFHYLMLNMFRMLIHPSSGACNLFIELFNWLYCSGSMCVGVTLWFFYFEKVEKMLIFRVVLGYFEIFKLLKKCANSR